MENVRSIEEAVEALLPSELAALGFDSGSQSSMPRTGIAKSTSTSHLAGWMAWQPKRLLISRPTRRVNLEAHRVQALLAVL